VNHIMEVEENSRHMWIMIQGFPFFITSSGMAGHRWFL